MIADGVMYIGVAVAADALRKRISGPAATVLAVIECAEYGIGIAGAASGIVDFVNDSKKKYL